MAAGATRFGTTLLGAEIVDKAIAELLKILQPRIILRRMAGIDGGAKHTDSVIQAIRKSAFAGIGPGSRKYTPYSWRYAKILLAAGRWGKAWLYGIKAKPGGHMLDASRFSTKVGRSATFSSTAFLDFVWSAATQAMAQYGEAHQEGLGNMPERTWMHADNKQIADAVEAATWLAINSLIINFEMDIEIPA